MPQINILNVLQGDNQSTVVDKINYNFDQILSAGGGPQGQQGLLGPTGAVGPQGSQGVQGVQGPSGTKWFVSLGKATERELFPWAPWQSKPFESTSKRGRSRSKPLWEALHGLCLLT